LEEKEYERVGSSQPIKMNARILSTTNRSLREEVAKGNFRKTLLPDQRGPLRIPPLRERVSDIPLLVQYLLRKFQEKGETVRVEPAVLEKLKGFPWPGNVRELANVVQHMMVFCRGNMISLEDLPPYLSGEAAD
jgi:DNA-binding NtrC family response regulator